MKINYFLTNVLFLLLLNFPTMARTATVVYNASGEATGISDLSIDGIDNILFNVEFVDGTYDGLYTTTTPYFLDDPTGALNATTAIISVLKENNVVMIDGISGECGISSPLLRCQIYIPNGINSPYTYSHTGALADSGTFWRLVIGASDRNVDYDFDVFTKFTEITTIPIPTSVFLFGSGLLGLAGMARRKKPI